MTHGLQYLLKRIRKTFGVVNRKLIILQRGGALAPPLCVSMQRGTVVNLTDFGFKKLFGTEQAEIAKFTPKERQEYQESIKDYWDYYSTVKTAHKKGKAEGRAEGLAETARKMKADGMPSGIIAKYTGLTAEQIENL